MKQIIPFKKELLFNTKVSEITAISLEHTLSLKNDDLISGEFHITGNYKMTEASINREKFIFKLPFEIALDSRYDISSMIIDIDNFYYQIINNEALQVNIDIYIEGKKQEEQTVVEEISEQMPIIPQENSKELEEIFKETTYPTEERNLTPILEKEEEKIMIPNAEELPKLSMIEPSIQKETIQQPISPRKEETREPKYKKTSLEPVEFEAEQSIEIHKNEFNIFENIDNSDTYVTYHVYVVKENDTIDKIIEKYGVTKEELSPYNNLDEVKTGTKLIIPNQNE